MKFDNHPYHNRDYFKDNSFKSVLYFNFNHFFKILTKSCDVHCELKHSNKNKIKEILGRL
jgi:hypothetical protein